MKTTWALTYVDWIKASASCRECKCECMCMCVSDLGKVPALYKMACDVSCRFPMNHRADVMPGHSGSRVSVDKICRPSNHENQINNTALGMDTTACDDITNFLSSIFFLPFWHSFSFFHLFTFYYFMFHHFILSFTLLYFFLSITFPCLYSMWISSFFYHSSVLSRFLHSLFSSYFLIPNLLFISFLS